MRAALLLAGLNAASAATAQEVRTPKVWRVPETTSAVTIDGVVDEAAWRQALRLELAYEVSPGDNVPPPVRTEVFLTYDRTRLLVAAKAYDPEPERIRARYTDHDQLFSDDWLGIALDTFDDQRRAYEFICNPLGAQMDAINDDVNGIYDTSWDGLWHSAGRITAEGYELEMAIPFQQLRFQDVSGEQTWGIDLFRSWPRRDRHHIGLWPRQRGANTYLGQADKIVGFAGVEPGNNLEVVPSLTASRTEERAGVPDGAMETVAEDVELGVTGRWGLTPDLTLAGALNPDFSQVEADAVQLEINERFALFYEEKRPFFLEGADTFTTPLNLLHTRTIVDPSVALKLTGKSGPHTWGVFSARDDVTTLVIPGSQGSVSGSFALATTATVGRYRYDFGRNSTIGAMLTDRRGGGYHNTVVGLDARLRFSRADTLTASTVWSDSRYADEMVVDLGLSEAETSGHAVHLNFNHGVRDWSGWVRFSDLADGFRSDLGFRAQVGYRRAGAGAEYVWWGEPGRGFNQVRLGTDVERTEEPDGDLLDQQAESWLQYNGPLQSVARLGFGIGDRGYAGQVFDQSFVSLYLEARPSGAVRAELEGEVGEWVDFTHVRPADRTSLATELELRLGRHLQTDLSYLYERMDVTGGRLYDAHVPQARVVYQLSLRCFLRAILQYTRLTRDPAVFSDPVEPEQEDLSSQLLFSYKLNPRSLLFLGYSDGYVGTSEFHLTQTDRTVFLKLSYAFLR